MKRALAVIVLTLLSIGLWNAQLSRPARPEAQSSTSEDQAGSNVKPADSTQSAAKPATTPATVISPILHADIHDPTSARAAMRALQDQQDCWLARSQRWRRDWESNTRSAWLPPEELEQTRAMLAQARQRLLAACERAGLSDDDVFARLQPRNWDEMLSLAGPLAAEIARAQRQALQAGDLQARMLDLANRRAKPDIDRELRPLLESALTQATRDGQLELLPELAQLLSRYAAPELGPLASWYGIEQNSSAANIDVDQRALWQLVACDLGLDCGAGSIALDRLCLQQGLCAYSSVEAAVYDGIVRSGRAHETELRRQWAVNRIRNGQISGMFDAVPNPGRGP